MVIMWCAGALGSIRVRIRFGQVLSPTTHSERPLFITTSTPTVISRICWAFPNFNVTIMSQKLSRWFWSRNVQHVELYNEPNLDTGCESESVNPILSPRVSCPLPFTCHVLVNLLQSPIGSTSCRAAETLIEVINRNNPPGVVAPLPTYTF